MRSQHPTSGQAWQDVDVSGAAAAVEACRRDADGERLRGSGLRTASWKTVLLGSMRAEDNGEAPSAGWGPWLGRVHPPWES